MKEEVRSVPIRDRRQPYHYTVDNEVYDMDGFAYLRTVKGKVEVKKMRKVLVLGVYNALARHAPYQGEAIEQTTVSQKKIHEELEISVRTVQRALEALVNAKLLLIERGATGEVNTYVLLQVPKAEYKPRYTKGTTEGRNTQKKGTTQGRNPTTQGRNPTTQGRNPTTQGRNPKSPKSKGHNGLNNLDDAAKTKIKSEKLQATVAAKYSTTLGKFTNRVIDWHEQCAKGTPQDYSSYKIAKWLGPHIRHLELVRVVEIFEHVARGVNPYVNAFWQTLREEREKQNKKLAKVEQTMLADMPV